MEVIHPRCAGVDVSKKDAKVCVRVQGSGRRGTSTTITTWGSTTGEVLALGQHLLGEQVSCVVIESTSDYWKPFYYLLEESLPVMLVNAKAARNVPGRKTDLLTELSAGSCGGCVRYRAGLARFAACDRRWGCAWGFVRAGGAAAGLSRGDGRSVSTVSAR
jgi:Transposase